MTLADEMKIDCHHHLWNYSGEEYGWISEQMSILRRDFAPHDLLAEIDQAKIDGVVTVQARQSMQETQWLLELAADHDFILGVVGWIPLASSDAESCMERWSDSGYLKAVRHVVQDEPDDAFILGTDFNRGVSQLMRYNLVYDILIYAKHLTNTIRFVDQHPNQPFVLDHIAKPTIESAQFDQQWAINIRELAKRENVTCKFSGVATEVRDASWTLESIKPYWDVALNAFGSKRLMFGSDWPVCLLKTGYGRWVETVSSLASELSVQEKRDFWGQNARRAYALLPANDPSSST